MMSDTYDKFRELFADFSSEDESDEQIEIVDQLIAELGIPADDSNISWEASSSKKWSAGRTDYGHVVYDNYFEEFLENEDVDVTQLSDTEIEDLIVDWATENIAVGEYRYGDLVLDYSELKFWYYSR